jgi:hypothetical protein
VSVSLEQLSSSAGTVRARRLPTPTWQDTTALPVPIGGYFVSPSYRDNAGSLTRHQPGDRPTSVAADFEQADRLARPGAIYRAAYVRAARQLMEQATLQEGGPQAGLVNESLSDWYTSSPTTAVLEALDHLLKRLRELQVSIAGAIEAAAATEGDADDWEYEASTAGVLDDVGAEFSFADLTSSTDEELMGDGFPFYVQGEWNEPALASLRRILEAGPPE